MSFSVEVLNTIRANADSLYQDRVPQATRDNIVAIGRVLNAYEEQYNTFITALVHKIGKTIIETVAFSNKLKPFKSGEILTEQDVEEIFIEQFRQAEGAYDPQGGAGTGGINPFKRRTYQDVKVNYHRMNRQDKYVMTISKIDVIRAFRSESALDTFITGQFNAIYTGVEYDEYVHMKQLFAEAIAEKGTDGNALMFTYSVPELDGSADSARAFIRTAKKAVKDMEYPSTAFNLAGVKTVTKPENLVMFVNKDVAVHMDVDLYAQIYGPEYAKMGITVVELDNFGSDDTGTYALICDKNWFKVYDTLSRFENLANPEGLYTNYWYHVWQILSYSRFKNCVRLAKASA